MITVTLYENIDGELFLHLQKDRVLWRMDERTASTFLTDAMVVANNDVASHPSIFSSSIAWNEQITAELDTTNIETGDLHVIAILTLDPAMGERGTAYTLFCPS